MTMTETRGEDMRMDLGALVAAVLSRTLRIIFVTVLLLAATYAVLSFMPKLYESSASLLVEQRSNAFTRAANEQPTSNSITMDSLMSSQIELIKSRDNLVPVIEELGLSEVREFNGAAGSPMSALLSLLGRKPEPKSIDQTVLETLSDHLTVIRERDSAVITILVRSQNPQLAADIANAIARNHVARRAGLSISDTAEASGWLETEIAKLRARVQEAETAVANFKVDNDLFQSGTANTSILDQQLSNIATQITSAQERKNNAASRANLIRGLIRSGQPIDGVADVRDSLVIQNLTQSKATLQGELAQRSSTLLNNHPTIKALRAQIAAIEGQIAAEGRKVADALDSQARIEAALEQSLNDDLARLKQSVSTATRDTVTLESLQREAKAQRDLLESYLARYSDANSRTDASSTLPDVRVVNEAAPSLDPASPKTGLILGAVGFIALALQIGAILFGELMSGRAITQRYVPVAAPVAPDEAIVALEEPVAPEPQVLEPEATAADAPIATPAAAKPSLFGFLRRKPRIPAAEPAFDEHLKDVANKTEAMAADEAEALPPAETPDLPQPPVAAPPLETPTPQPSVATTATSAAAFAAAALDQPPPTAPTGRTAGEAALELSNLAADIAIGRVRVVFLAALESYEAVERVAEMLVDSAIERGLSVATIDAGSGRLSEQPGLTDLASEDASFGDVVYKHGEGHATVPWGRSKRLERRSMKPVTLVEALTDIYEVVIVSTGAVDMFSALPVFSGVEGRLVLVSDEHYPDRTAVEASLEQSAALGYEVGQMVAAPAHRSVA